MLFTTRGKLARLGGRTHQLEVEEMPVRSSSRSTGCQSDKESPDGVTHDQDVVVLDAIPKRPDPDGCSCPAFKIICRPAADCS